MVYPNFTNFKSILRLELLQVLISTLIVGEFLCLNQFFVNLSRHFDEEDLLLARNIVHQLL